MADFAKEGGHWYCPITGEPRYTMIGKNGKERAVTLRDARPNGWVPSVTTISAMGAKPALTAWMIKTVLLSAATLPKIDGETADAWVARVSNDWQEESRRARDVGERIHGAVEKHYRGDVPDDDLFPWVQAVARVVRENCGELAWSAERSFACDLGYGGKCDLHSPEWIIDLKSKDGPADGRKLWDEELQQLAAYRRGLGYPNARCAIVHIDRNAPTADFIEADEDDLARGLEMFDCLLNLWQAKNRYYPSRLKVAA